jgi:hypothetical protein
VDPVIIDLVKTIGGVLLSTGGAVGFYLIFRRIDEEIKKALREDNATLRAENRLLRKDLRDAEGRNDETESSSI